MCGHVGDSRIRPRIRPSSGGKQATNNCAVNTTVHSTKLSEGSGHHFPFLRTDSCQDADDPVDYRQPSCVQVHFKAESAIRCCQMLRQVSSSKSMKMFTNRGLR